MTSSPNYNANVRGGMAGLLTFLLATLSGIAAGVQSPSTGTRSIQTPSVEISKFAFTPKEITVTPGTKVIWTNHDETPHTVTSKDKVLASPGMDTDDKYEHTFDGEGDFAYICTVHPFMTGIVHVRKP